MLAAWEVLVLGEELVLALVDVDVALSEVRLQAAYPHFLCLIGPGLDFYDR